MFTKVEEQLADLSFAQESLKETWVVVSRTVTAETFATTGLSGAKSACVSAVTMSRKAKK